MSGLLSTISHSGLPAKMLYAFVVFDMPLDYTIIITLLDEYKFWSCELCYFLLPPITSPILDPNAKFSAIFSNNIDA